ncbi:MAG: hypothetical protein ACFCVB_08950 [Nodosilinea sp.]
MRVPTTWKDSLVVLRDTQPEQQMGDILSALANLTPEQAATLGTLLQNPDAIAAAVSGTPATSGNAELPQQQTVLGRAVPYGLVGLLSRILDVALEDPGRAREVLLRTAKFL